MLELGASNGRVLQLSGLILGVLCFVLVLSYASNHMLPAYTQTNPTVTFTVDSSSSSGHRIPSTLFGLFFEEINHAGTGGLWAELVQNRGFEAGGLNTPSDIRPWVAVGTETQVLLGTDRSSPFVKNPVALRVAILCDAEDSSSSNQCPHRGVGVSNPGFWGMDIREGATYKVKFWLRSTASLSLSVSFTSADGSQTLAQKTVEVDSKTCHTWLNQSLELKATASDHYARLYLTSRNRSIFWLDQVSAMPTDTFKGHGFRKELALMLADLKPGFFRFPGGCFVEGDRLINSFRWRETVGPYEERPGHYGDVWNYWTDDGFGFFEGLQLAEDLGALPIWVFNNGISHQESVPTELIGAYVLDTLDGIEFARGPSNSTWGALRSQMGHPDPFDLRYMAIGNEDCWKPYYRGNYMKFYEAIKAKYPDMQLISNCDGSKSALDHPADLYDYHVYTSANNLFAMRHQFDDTSRYGPKVFVSEYAVTGNDAGRGSFLAGLAEAGFLIGIELNSDVVSLASYAPLFVNNNDRRWNPDAIVFDSWQQYGTPGYWMQQFFKHSNNASLLYSTVQADAATNNVLIMSALRAKNDSTGSDYLVVKAVNYGGTALNLQLVITNMPSSDKIQALDSSMTILTSANLMDENSFSHPTKVVPTVSKAETAGPNMRLTLPAFSIMALQLGLSSMDADM